MSRAGSISLFEMRGVSQVAVDMKSRFHSIAEIRETVERCRQPFSIEEERRKSTGGILISRGREPSLDVALHANRDAQFVQASLNHEPNDKTSERRVTVVPSASRMTKPSLVASQFSIAIPNRIRAPAASPTFSCAWTLRSGSSTPPSGSKTPSSSSYPEASGNAREPRRAQRLQRERMLAGRPRAPAIISDGFRPTIRSPVRRRRSWPLPSVQLTPKIIGAQEEGHVSRIIKVSLADHSALPLEEDRGRGRG